MNAKVGIVVINWNALERTRGCLKSIFAQTYENISVVVVDNGSTEVGFDQLGSEFPKIIPIKNRYNLGFAKASNLGAEKALSEKCDLVFFVNNDAILDGHCIEEIVKYSQKHPEASVLGCKIREDRPTINKLNDLYTLWTHRRISQVSSDGGPVSKVWGCGMAVRAHVMEECGLFWTGFFAYFEDKEYCWRVQKKGFSVHYVPSAILDHNPSSSTGGIASDSPLRAYLIARNRMQFVRIKTGRWGLIAGACLLCAQAVHSIFFIIVRPKPLSSLSSFYGAAEGIVAKFDAWPRFPKWVCQTDQSGMPV